MDGKGRANRKTKKKSDGKRGRQTERKRERPRKCLQGASQEEVPVAVTTAVALVAMGTSRAEKTESGQQGQNDSVLPFLREGNTGRKYLKTFTICNLLIFELDSMVCFSSLDPACERDALVVRKKQHVGHTTCSTCPHLWADCCDILRTDGRSHCCSCRSMTG